VIVLVTGTGTDVGKTWFAAATARALRAHGLTVRAWKPVQSFAPGDTSTDADVLAAATGQESEAVCAPERRYPIAVAPPMASDRLGRPPFTIADLAADLPVTELETVLLVEGAGGPRSPLAHDGDTVDLAAALPTDVVVLVSDAGLGTINATRVCADALTQWPLVVALNRFDERNELHRDNRDWLRTRTSLEVITNPEALAVHLQHMRR
jgi:dethiobiotin synthetase